MTAERNIGGHDPCADRPGLSLAVVTTHPIQYQCPIWQRLAKLDGIARFKVFFASDFSVRGYRDPGFGTAVRWDGDLLSGYESQVFSHVNSARWSHLGRRVMMKAVVGFRPDVCLVNAYTPPLYLRVIAACASRSIPVLLRAEATDADHARTRIKQSLRDAALRLLYRQISAFAAIGVNARSHYLRLGVRPDKISFAPYCIDTERFRAQFDRVSRGAERARHGVPAEAFVVLFAGKLIPKKDPLTLLRALRTTDRVDGRPVYVWMLGDGELRDQIEQFARAEMPGRVKVLGFRPQHELGQVYCDADVMVLPSIFRETWGLVVNEALTFGVPCVVSDRVGCAGDLITPGETGLVFRNGDAKDLSDCVVRLLGQVAEDREAIASKCRERVARYTVDAAARGILEGAQIALGRR